MWDDKKSLIFYFLSFLVMTKVYLKLLKVYINY